MIHLNVAQSSADEARELDLFLRIASNGLADSERFHPLGGEINGTDEAIKASQREAQRTARPDVSAARRTGDRPSANKANCPTVSAQVAKEFLKQTALALPEVRFNHGDHQIKLSCPAVRALVTMTGKISRDRC